MPGLDFPTREGEEFSTTPQASEAYKLGQAIERGGEAISPRPVPELEESFLATKIPQAVGSGVGFLLGGGVARLLRRGVTRAGTLAAERKLAEAAAEKAAPLGLKIAAGVSEGAEIGTLGATSQFQSEYEKAINAGADRDTALKAGLLGLPIGATEAIPLSNMLRRLDRFSEGGFTRYLLTAGKEAFEEGLQEAAQNFASNAVEKGLYNEAKSLTDDLIPQAGAGGAAGFLLSTLTQALGAGVRRARTSLASPSGQTQGVKALPDRLAGAVKVFSDFPQRQALLEHGFQNLSVNDQREVMSHVRAGLGDEQIGDLIVKSVPVGVMNDLIGKKLPAEEGLDDKAVLINRLRAAEVRPELSVGALAGRFIDSVLSEPAFRVTGRGAKNALGVLPVTQIPKEGFAAADTLQVGHAQLEQTQKGETSAKTNLEEIKAPSSQTPQLVGETQAGVRVRDIAPQVPLEAKEGARVIAQALQERGVAESPRVAVVNNPAPEAPAARAVFDADTNQFLRIELNQAKVDSARGLGQRFDHEVSHVASDSGALREVLDVLTPQERGDIAIEMSRLGYPEGSQNEFDARGTDALVAAWNNRTWFGRLVGRVTAWANEALGIRLTRRAAEAIAVRAVGRSVQQLRTAAPATATRERSELAAAPVLSAPIQGVQVAGAAAQLGRVAEEAYAKREAAGTQLEGLAYERKQFKTAKQELRRVTELATGRLFQEGLSLEDNPGMFPDPDEGVGIVDGQVVVGDEFLNKLLVGGEAPNPENTKAMQGEVYFEKEAHRLSNLRGQIDLLQRAVGYYEALGVEQPETDKIQTRINKLSAQATNLSEAQWNGKTIGERTNEIEAAEAEKPGLIAQRQALGLKPVGEFFGRQVGGYRQFLEKAQRGAKIAALLKEGANADPAALQSQLADAAGWLTLHEDVRQAILSGKTLTDEQRASAFASLASAFEDFDIQRAQMGALRDSRQQDINQGVAKLTDAISTAKIEKGMASVLIKDVNDTLGGESGGTGTLQSEATAQWLKGSISAITEFAEKLGKNIETNGALFDWLTNPSGPVPSATALGIDPHTFEMILSEVKKNPAFGSAVVTLVNAADKKLANLPIVQLEQIQTLLQQGETQAANAAAQAMISNAKQRASLAVSSQRQNLRELEALDIERQSLDEGVAMFNELAASPEFRQLRDAVSNSPYGLLDPMDVSNNVARTLRAFGGKGIPSHPEVKLGAADSAALKSEDFVRVHRWNKAAQEHLDAYAATVALYQADPQNNPSPSSLGFDLPTIRGLRDAVKRSVAGSALELSTQDPNSRWKVPWLVRAMNRTTWFRQHDFVAKMVGGLVGTDLRAKLGDWINHFLISRSVTQKYRDIPELRHAAMKSHPEVQMNQALYRTFWNELAHRGRTFGSPLRAGDVLPGSGRAVTAEDLALLKRETEFEEDLRRKVTETTPVLGVRVQKGNRTLVRPGAYVGDLGLPRHLNVSATPFISGVIAAYAPPTKDDPIRSFGIADDLGLSSSNPVVQFWNRKPKRLTQHVLDSTRDDRAMRLDPMMAQAERTAAADWMMNGTPPIQNLDELATELVKHFPSAPGLNIREQVVKGLNEELRQYRDAAARIDAERTERDAARNSKVQISFSADNEFTRPAAQLELPSELYDYGALTDTDHILIQSRANHERIVAYATTLQRSIAELRSRLQLYRDQEMTEKEAFHGGTVDEAKDVLGLLEKIYKDFDSAYAMGSPALTQGGWFREATGLLTSAVLALPTVNLRNMTQGQFEVYLMSRAMGLGGQAMLFRQALLNMPKTLVRYALHIGSGIAKRTDLGAAFLTGKNHEIFTKLVDAIAKMMFQGNYRASTDRIHQLGFDTRDGFFERMRRLWQQSEESAQPEELRDAKLFGRRAGKLFGIPPNALRALFDTIGVQESDLTINAALLNYGTMLEKRLQEVAANYGAERERQGLINFDPTNPAWGLKPDEWASGNQQAAKDSLGLFRLFMEQAAGAQGFQLEKALWDYYQRSKSGPSRLFTGDQFDAVQRGLLAQFNASTPANRASAAAGNNTVRNLLTLQGYVSDGMLKLLNAVMGGTRDRTLISTGLAKLPMIASLALMSVLIGYMVGAITGEWEKRVRGRAPSLPTPLDGDFYTSFKRWGAGTAKLGLAQLFYLGDVILALNGEISGNRGFDPVGRVFPISVAQRFLGALRGMWTTQSQASIGERLQPGLDVVRSMVPWFTELERVYSSTVSPVKQSTRVVMGEAQNQDLLPERRAQPFTGPQYGPTTIVRRGLVDAVGRYWVKQQEGDEAGAAQALETAKVQLKKLEDYYAAKYVKAGATPEAAAYKARQDVWRDYQELNPAVAGMLGKRPTKAEWDAIRGAITGDRAKAVDDGIAAWQAGAQALFGRAAPITREDVAAGRASIGGGRGGVAGIPSAIPRGRRIGGLRRVGSLRRVGGRTAAPRLAVRRAGTARLGRRRALGIRAPRLARPRLRRLAGPRVTRLSAGRKRLGLAPRRRRRQAAGA